MLHWVMLKGFKEAWYHTTVEFCIDQVVGQTDLTQESDCLRSFSDKYYDQFFRRIKKFELFIPSFVSTFVFQVHRQKKTSDVSNEKNKKNLSKPKTTKRW